jgi:ADP-ribosyl-[dinitrogen reductase] hydrolase
VAGLLEEANMPLRDALDYVGADAPDELVAALEPLARGDSPATVETSGYVVHSVQTALLDGLSGESAEDAIVTAVNRGGDTDTIGGIAGAVAGARFGASTLPDRWLTALDATAELESLAAQLRSV